MSLFCPVIFFVKTIWLVEKFEKIWNFCSSKTFLIGKFTTALKTKLLNSITMIVLSNVVQIDISHINKDNQSYDSKLQTPFAWSSALKRILISPFLLIGLFDQSTLLSILKTRKPYYAYSFCNPPFQLYSSPNPMSFLLRNVDGAIMAWNNGDNNAQKTIWFITSYCLFVILISTRICTVYTKGLDKLHFYMKWGK